MGSEDPEEEEDTRDTVADTGVATVADTVVMTTGVATVADTVVMTTGATQLGRAALHIGLEVTLNPLTSHVLLHVLQAASQERPRAERLRVERLRKVGRQ